MNIFKKTKAKKGLPVAAPRHKWSRLTGDSREKEYFIDNLSMLLSSGMDILAALDAIQEGVRTRTMKNIIDTLKADVNDGRPLWKSLKETNLLSLHILSLFRIGEESGQLSENLKVINEQQQKERIFKSKINSAMMYPVLVLSLTLIVGIGIAWFILPRLSVVFLQLKMDLPAITKGLINLGNFLGEHGVIVIPLFLLALFLIFYVIFIANKTKWIGQFLLSHFPVVKTVIQEIELSRFGYILGNLLDAGIPIVEALNSLADATTFRSYSRLYAFMAESIEQGNSLQKSFIAYPGIKPLMPATIQQMVASGEQSGNLSNMLRKIGATFEEKTETSTKNLSVLLEPILLIIVWGGVIMVALAVILPIYSLIGGLNDPAGNMETRVVEKPSAQQLVVEEIIEEPETLTLIVDDTVDWLNVRDEPFGDLITRVSPGETYNYTEEKDDWYQISLPNEEKGWVSGDYVTLLNYASAPKSRVQEEIESEESEKSFLEILPTGIGYLNVRQEPLKAIIGKVEPGNKYEYINERGGWYQIIFANDQKGWISGSYVKTLNDD